MIAVRLKNLSSNNSTQLCSSQSLTESISEKSDKKATNHKTQLFICSLQETKNLPVLQAISFAKAYILKDCPTM